MRNVFTRAPNNNIVVARLDFAFLDNTWQYDFAFILIANCKYDTGVPFAPVEPFAALKMLAFIAEIFIL